MNIIKSVKLKRKSQKSRKIRHSTKFSLLNFSSLNKRIQKDDQKYLDLFSYLLQNLNIIRNKDADIQIHRPETDKPYSNHNYSRCYAKNSRNLSALKYNNLM